jgi:hypothetical protein
MDAIGGKLEAGLAFDASMTAGVVAATAREDANHVPGKAERALLVRTFNFQGS